jgi:hypothetical protein
MPDLIRHPEYTETTGFWPSPEWRFIEILTFVTSPSLFPDQTGRFFGQRPHVYETTVISGLLTSIGKTFREALISKEPTKFVVKISVNSRCNRVYQK